MRLSPALTSLGAVSLLLGLSACSGAQADDTAAGGDAAPTFGTCEVTGTRGEFALQTIAPKTLTVKADLPSTGWYNGDTVESIDSGVDYCLLATIAHRAGLDKIQLVNTSWDGLIAGKAGAFDLSLNQITINDERKRIFDFSDPYFESTAGLLVKKGADVTAENLKTKRIGVKQGTVGQILGDRIAPTTPLSVFPGDPELRAAVAAGRVDVGIQDLSIVMAAAKESGDRLAVAGQVKTDEKYGAIFTKGSPNVAVVNKIVKAAIDDGSVERFSKVYLTEAYGLDPTAVPVWTVQ